MLTSIAIKVLTTFSVVRGGLLIASAHFGAYVYGTDIDYNTVHGLAPYGIRESTRRTGSQKEIPKGIEKCPESHVPVSLSYHLSDMFFDLLNFAAETLVLGGRLVYWLPVYTPEYTEEMVPWHPCLKLISNCEQKLSSHTSRRLITMEKVKEFEGSTSTDSAKLCILNVVHDPQLVETEHAEPVDAETRLSDLSICQFWYPQWVLEPISCGCQGRTVP
ncbi:tRNA (guanine(10)-N2)-methyltransferase, partial [Eschrichtius robustus]|nr:tRNA (guanine(10)-N2)-methyltransferase [Eschrichtius robustus]